MLAAIVEKANAGSQEHLSELRRILDGNPALWKAAGDVAGHAESAWVKLLAGGNAMAELSIPRRLKELKAELLDADSTPLEKLIVAYIGTTWLAAQHSEIGAAREGGSLGEATFRCRRAESAA